MSGTMSRVLLNACFTDTEVQDGKLVYIFDKKQHAQTLLHNLIVMQDNEEGSLTDVVITSNENEQFHFHAPILAVLGKNLEETLLRQGLGSAASKNSKIVMEENFSSAAVQCLWDYAYTSVVTLTPSNINEVKEMAEHHGIDSLKKECEVQQQQNFNDDCDGVELKFENLSEFILTTLYTLLKGSKVCSVAITSSDPLAKIPCHGALLAAASSELARGDTHEDLQVNDDTFQGIPSFLRYLYTAKLMVEGGTVQQLLEMAVEFNMPGMGYACCSWLKDALSSDNALDIMSIAKTWQANVQDESSCAESDDGFKPVSLYDALGDLYHSARSQTLKDFLDIQDSDEYLEMSLEELIDLIVDDDIVVNSEEDVFYAVMKWVEFDPETRGVELPNLLQSVRLEYLSVGFLYTIMEHDLVKSNSYCVEVIEKALKDLLQQNYPAEEDVVQPSEGTEFLMPDFNSKQYAPINYDPTFVSPNQPERTPVSEPIPFDITSSPEYDDQPYDDENSLLEPLPGLPRKPDMRLRKNRKALLERGKNLDGTPDKRLRENKTKESVARKLKFPEEDLPRRKDGKPDMRFKVNKTKASKPNDQDATLKLMSQGPTRKDGQPDMRFKANRFPKEGVLCVGPTRKDGKPDMRYAANKRQMLNNDHQNPQHNTSTTGPKKKDGSLDMRFSVNKKAAATVSGPLKKDGTPDMRFAVNKLPSDTTAKTAPGPQKKDGSLDMRYAVNKGLSGTTSSGPLKKDGTPDRRYSSNRGSPDVRGSSGGLNSSNASSSGPLKKDGTPDMRYRSNKSSNSSSAGSGYSSIGGSTMSVSSGSSGSYGSSVARGPLKKDGTPDMRYRSNKSSNGSSAGSGYSSIGGSTMSVSSGSSGSYGSSVATGPLKRDGTPDMRYRSNKSSNSSSAGSGYSRIGGSTMSVSSGSSGSYGSSVARGPLKRDGTPDMRYRSNQSFGSGSSFGSISSLSSGWSSSSFSSGYSGSSSYSSSSGPMKKDGTPDMRYKANRR